MTHHAAINGSWGGGMVTGDMLLDMTDLVTCEVNRVILFVVCARGADLEVEC